MQAVDATQWEDCLAAYRDGLKALTSTTVLHHLRADREALLSAPELFDANTDGALGFGAATAQSLEGLIKAGAVPSAAELDAAATTQAIDALMAREMQFLRGAPRALSIHTFAYIWAFARVEKAARRGAADAAADAAAADDGSFTVIMPADAATVAGPLSESLRCQSVALHAYCRALLLSADDVTDIVSLTQVHDVEEFAPQGHFRDHDASRAAALAVAADLAEAAASAEAKGDVALAARLRFRREYLLGVDQLTTFIQPLTVEGRPAGVNVEAVAANGPAAAKAAAAHFAAASAALKSFGAAAATATPLVEDARLFRPNDTRFFEQLSVPPKASPATVLAATFPEMCAAWQAYLTQLESLAALFDGARVTNSLIGLFDAVEQLGAQRPLVPVRSAAAVMILSAPSRALLGGPSIEQRVLDALSFEYGAPLYADVALGASAAAVAGVVSFFASRNADGLAMVPPAIGRSPPQLAQRAVEMTRMVVAEIAQTVLVLLEAHLCSRGRCHRRLVNALPQLAQVQSMAFEVDTGVYSANVSGLNAAAIAQFATVGAGGTTESPLSEAEATQALTQRAAVLTALTTELALRAQAQILSLTVELDLVSTAELPATLGYLAFVNASRVDNMTNLVLASRSEVPPPRVHPKSGQPQHNPALVTRRPLMATSGAAAFAAQAAVKRADTERLAAELTSVLLVVLDFRGLLKNEAGAPFLNFAPRALTTVANVFNHRFSAFMALRRSPYRHFEVSNAQAAKLRAELDGSAASGDAAAAVAAGVQTAKELTTKYGGVARNLSSQLKPFVTGPDTPVGAKAAFEGLERSLRGVSASLALLALSENPAADFDVTMNHQFHPSLFSMSVKPKKK